MSFARIVLLVLVLAVLFAVVAFAVLNPHERVDLDLFWARYVDVPLVQGLFVAFILGGLLSLLYGAIVFLGLQRRIRKLQRTMREKDRELTALRTLPLDESPEADRPAPQPFTASAGRRDA